MRPAIAAIVALAAGLAAEMVAAENVRLFAAASTTTVMEEVADLYAGAGHGRVVGVFANSSALAQQIVNGAPADIYVSANERWMDFVEGNGAIAAPTRKTLLTNRLVLIAPVESAWSLSIEPGFALADALDRGYLAMGDPEYVPAGIYARQALTRLGVWDTVAPNVARAANVRTALAQVARREAAAGIVYATDAPIVPEVRVVAAFPADSHESITYPAAVVAGQETRAVMAFFAFLFSDSARAVYARHGFGVAADASAR